MPKIPNIQIPFTALEQLFNKLDIWSKINDGRLNSRVVYHTPSKKYSNPTSEIIKHFTSDGKHVATTHRIRDKTGEVLHWDAKDVKYKGFRYWRP